MPGLLLGGFYTMGKRTRLEIYDQYPNDEIDRAINRWINKKLQRMILHYILVDGYTYEKTAELIEQDTGQFISYKTVQRQVYSAQKKLYAHLEVIYHPEKHIDDQ